MDTKTIGDASGRIWHTLAEHGPLSVPSLAKTTRLAPNVVHAAIGWLAREGKLEFTQEGKGVVVSLTPAETSRRS